jgi:hypothetical protein
MYLLIPFQLLPAKEQFSLYFYSFEIAPHSVQVCNHGWWGGDLMILLRLNCDMMPERWKFAVKKHCRDVHC